MKLGLTEKDGQIIPIFRVQEIRGSPWEPTPGRSDDAIPSRVRFSEEGSIPLAENPDNLGEPPRDIRKRARITREDVVRIGFTVN